MRNDEADEVQWCNGEEMELEEYAREWEGTERQGTGRRWRSMQAVSRRAKRAEWSIGMDWEMDRCVDRVGDKGWQWRRPWQCEEGIDWLREWWWAGNEVERWGAKRDEEERRTCCYISQTFSWVTVHTDLLYSEFFHIAIKFTPWNRERLLCKKLFSASSRSLVPFSSWPMLF